MEILKQSYKQMDTVESKPETAVTETKINIEARVQLHRYIMCMFAICDSVVAYTCLKSQLLRHCSQLYRPLTPVLVILKVQV